MIHTGDCIEVMRGMEADSVDAVVTDPPAGIAFMSKHWDRDKGGRTEWVAWMTEVMRECYRVLKPGGYAVVWSLPRTCHWTAWAMEDAGFIIRDQLAHIFASGFPKGKAQLKPAREDWWLARKPGPLRPLGIDECRIGRVDGDRTEYGRDRTLPHANVTSSLGKFPEVTPYTPATGGRWPSNVLLDPDYPELFDEPNPYVVGSGATVHVNPPGQLSTYNHGPAGDFGFGPRQPFGYDTDGGYSRFFRIPKKETRHGDFGSDARNSGDSYMRRADGNSEDQGHVPERPPGRITPTAFLIPKADRADREPIVRGSLELGPPPASARSTPAEGRQNALGNPRENAHPTVKPTDLMRHLVRLVTPPGGTVLDPFLGSGSTAIACELEGFPWVGIEQDATYVEIAYARLNGVQRGMGLDVSAPSRRPLRSPIEKRASVVRVDLELFPGVAGPAESDEVA